MAYDMSKVADDNFEFQKIVVVLGFTLLFIKYLAYWLTGSVAIFTDATESIVNVVAACVGIYALYLSAQPADKNHPFGHGKIEIISSSIEGAMILTAGILILYETIDSFINPGEISNQLDIGMVLIALAALANYVVGRAAIRKGKKNRSSALVASGKHLCSDTLSSVGILIGLVVVYIAESMGYDAAWLDSSIAAVFGVIIIATGGSVLKRAVDDAMDAADLPLLNEVTETVKEYRHDDWIDVYNLRLIKFGPKIFVDMKVVLPKKMTVEEQSLENSELAEAIRSKYGDSVEISVNPVPCMPYHCRYCSRNCLYRSYQFEHIIEWNADVLCTTETHVPHCYLNVEQRKDS